MNAVLKQASEDNAAVTNAMAAFALADARFPALARSRARDAIIDCVGCMLAGSREALAAPLLAVLPSFDQANEQATAQLLGTERWASPADAALFNGTIAHALDYDDTNHPAYAHPSAVIVPALLALAPQCAPSGADLIDAYIVGFEAFGKLGRALNKQHYKRGWHATGTFGALAAALAAGRLLKLDHHQMVMCIGIAASSAAGLRANFGSMTKPFHAGQSARAGLLAALLAKHGFDASGEAMDHAYGFVRVFNDGIGHDTAHLLRMGEDLEILTEHGLALKPFPACGATHPGIEAAMLLHKDSAGEPLKEVRAGVCEMAFAPLIHVMPHAPLEGKFSLHYCVAAALVEGDVGLHSFTPEKIADPRIRALIPRIRMEVDEDLRHDSEFATRIVAVTESGKRFERFVPLAMGKPARWFDVERIRAKFRDCAADVLGSARCDSAFAALLDLDSAAPATATLAALRTAR
ncbi:MmgE/PrpD family protein [Ramlibacter sp.]|uniref:MmgE/PrpD family protein n=1 Tax=Ramlibacter sp. TaxID=1917967 RepID=UPI003D14BDD4